MSKSVFKRFFGLVFLEKCALCKKPTGAALCDNCLEKLKPLSSFCCEVCGKPIGSCVCKKIDSCFKRCVSAFRFEDEAVSALVYKLKKNGSREVACLLADALAARVRSELGLIKFDYVTFVPMRKAVRRRKGFDHAQLLAKELALKLDIVFTAPPLERKKSSKQKYLEFDKRKNNAQSAFVPLSRKLLSGSVLVIDDVMTTGSTLSACSHILLNAGAREVYCATAATSVKK